MSADTIRHAARTASLLSWALPAMLLVAAADAVMTGRDLTRSFQALEAVQSAAKPAAVEWLQRAVSLLLLAASAQQVAAHLSARRQTPSPLLLVAFIAYWIGSVAAPAVLGAHPHASHDLAYAPAVGVAACLCGPQDRDALLRRARDLLLALMALGLLLAPLRPTLVLDPSYAEGLLPGLPRFAGLTQHPVTQGALAQVALLLLWACPYRSRTLRLGAWALGLGVLLLAQSKAAWIAFAACALAMGAVRNGPALRQRLGDPNGGGFGVAACALAALAVAGVAAALLAGTPGQRLGAFLDTGPGAQLASFSGRDRIWAAALAEWQDHPAFGYGLTLWDAGYRAAVGLPQATHAHNQLMEDAARAGTVGALALVAYALVLAALSLRAARASGGLSIALFLAIALRAVSEVPLSLLGYGSELLTHLLLLAVLAAAATKPAGDARAAADGAKPRTTWRHGAA